ncbi:hypothetical protein LCGC14_1661420, partial [marine sediment metagenome]
MVIRTRTGKVVTGLAGNFGFVTVRDEFGGTSTEYDLEAYRATQRPQVEPIAREPSVDRMATNLLSQGRTTATLQTLRDMGATDIDIDEFFFDPISGEEAEPFLIPPFEGVRPSDIRDRFQGLLETVFPGRTTGVLEQDFETLRQFAVTDTDMFLSNILVLGRTEDTEMFLTTLFPEATEQDLTELFGVEALDITPIGVTELGERVNMPWWEGAWNSLRLGIMSGLQQTRQSLFTVGLPNLFPYAKEGEPKPELLLPFPFPVTEEQRRINQQVFEARGEGLTYTEEEAAIANRELEPWRAQFREVAINQEAEFAAWQLKHPELEPKPEYRQDPFENPELLTDMGWWIHTMAETMGTMLPSLVAGIGVTFLTKAPTLGALTTAAAMTPLEMQGLYDDLIQAGAPVENAEELALVIGAAIASVEVGPGLILMKAIYPVFKPFRRGMQTAVVKAVMRNMIAKGIKTFTAIEVS